MLFNILFGGKDNSGVLQTALSGLPHLSPFRIPLHFPDKITVFPDNFYSFFNHAKKQLLTVINSNFTQKPRIFERQKFITVIISRTWVYICQVDIYINTTQVEPLSYDGSFNLKIMSWQNSLTIPWHDITKFPSMTSQNPLTIPWHGSNAQNSLTFFKKNL